MKSKLFIVFLSLLVLIPAILLAQPEIPDHCFINGEVDCTRPECEHICFTKPTPGHDMPIAAPQLGLENDTLEEGAMQIIGRPRLAMPFHEDPPAMDTTKEIKSSERIYIPKPCPQKESVQLQIAKFDLESYQGSIKYVD